LFLNGVLLWVLGGERNVPATVIHAELGKAGKYAELLRGAHVDRPRGNGDAHLDRPAGE